MNKSEFMQEENMDLFDLWRRLRNGWRYVLGGVAIGVLGAVGAIALIPLKYEAVAVVQVGSVGQVGQVLGYPVEPVTLTLERMKTPTFQLGVARRLGNEPWRNDLLRSAGAATKYVSLQIVKSTAGTPAPLIELRTNADSPEEAKKMADALVLELAKRHAEIAAPMIDKIRQDLLIAKERVASAERELEGVSKLVANAGTRDDRFSQLSLLGALRAQKEAELFSQRQALVAFETALSAPATQSAKAIEEAFVSDGPISPKKGLLVSVGLLGGLLSGLVATFVADAWRAKSRSTAVSDFQIPV